MTRCHQGSQEVIDYMETHVFFYVFYLMFYLYLFLNIIDIRFCYKYEGDNMETALPPNMQLGEKITIQYFMVNAAFM